MANAEIGLLQSSVNQLQSRLEEERASRLELQEKHSTATAELKETTGRLEDLKSIQAELDSSIMKTSEELSVAQNELNSTVMSRAEIEDEAVAAQSMISELQEVHWVVPTSIICFNGRLM